MILQDGRIRDVQRKLDVAFAVFILIVMTQSYRYLAVLLGLPGIFFVTAIITIFCVFYIYVRKGSVIRSLRFFGLLLFALILWPFLTYLYSPSTSYREFLLLVHYFLLMCASALFFQRMVYLEKITISALLISVIAMAVSIQSPELFTEMAAMAMARFDYLGRGSGFFLQPNLLAYNLVLIMLLIYMIVPKRDNKKLAFLVTIFVIGVFFSGSRGGMLAAFVFFLGHIVVDRRLLIKRFLTSFIVLLAGGFFLLVLVRLTQPGALLYWQFYMNRVASIFNERIYDDGSVLARVAYQSEYIDWILQKPLFGHGVGSVSYLIEYGSLIGAAHNQFLDYTLQYGLVGLLILIICAFGFFIALRLKISSATIGSSLLIVVVITVTMMGTNMIFNMQNFYILLGYVFSKLPSGMPPFLDTSKPHAVAASKASGLKPPR